METVTIRISNAVPANATSLLTAVKPVYSVQAERINIVQTAICIIVTDEKKNKRKKKLQKSKRSSPVGTFSMLECVTEKKIILSSFL